MKLTFWSLVALIGVVTVAAPILQWKCRPTFWTATLIAGVVFIPSCTGIMAILDKQRFGVFQYETFDDINDFRVQRYLPPAAITITVEKHMQRFRARYSITEVQLMDYLDDIWDQYGKQSIIRRGELDAEQKLIGREMHELTYGDLGWPPLEDAVEFHSPRASNGAGFSVWYSPTEGVAYERADYW